MFRKNQLLGISLIAFGGGVLLAIWAESPFFCCCCAGAAIFFGFWMGMKKC